MWRGKRRKKTWHVSKVERALIKGMISGRLQKQKVSQRIQLSSKTYPSNVKLHLKVIHASPLEGCNPRWRAVNMFLNSTLQYQWELEILLLGSEQITLDSWGKVIFTALWATEIKMSDEDVPSAHWATAQANKHNNHNGLKQMYVLWTYLHIL